MAQSQGQTLPIPYHFASKTHPSYLRQNFNGPSTAFIQVASTPPCQNQTRISDARTPSQLRHRDLRPSGSLAGRGLIISHEWKEDSPLSPSPRIRRAILRQFADPCSCWHVDGSTATGQPVGQTVTPNEKAKMFLVLSSPEAG